MVLLRTPLGAGKERASSCRVVFLEGFWVVSRFLLWVVLGFFSGSRVFLLGFLVGFGLGPLGVFFFFCAGFGCSCIPPVYWGRLTLFNKLTYKKKKKKQDRIRKGESCFHRQYSCWLVWN
jgi:hypothetical protein